MSGYEYVKKNFSKLVKKYGGQYVIVAGDKIFSGKNPRTLEKEASAKYPKEIPFGTPIPKPEDLSCAL